VPSHHQRWLCHLTINVGCAFSPSTLVVPSHHQRWLCHLTINVGCAISPSTLVVPSHHQRPLCHLTINVRCAISPSTFVVPSHHKRCTSARAITPLARYSCHKYDDTIVVHLLYTYVRLHVCPHIYTVRTNVG